MSRPAPRVVGRRYLLQCRQCRRWFRYPTREGSELAYALHIDGGMPGLVKPCPQHRKSEENR